MRKTNHLLLAVLFALGACKEKAPDKAVPDEVSQKPGETAAPAAATVALQLNWVPEPEFGGFYAADHLGFYREAGLSVDIVAGSAGVQTWKMVATGKVPFAVASAGEVLRARLKDADLVALFAVYQKNPQALMVHEASGVTGLEEIFTSGKIQRVAMEAGLPYVHFLKKTHGLDKVQVIQYSGNLSLFLQDPAMAQQCFVFSEPVSAQQQGVAVRAFSVADAGFNPYLAVVITSRAYLDQHRDQVEAFVRASRRGWQAYLDNPEPANQYMRTKGATMELAAMKAAAELQASYVVSGETEASGLGIMTEARWRTLAEQLHEIGELGEVPDVTGAFVNIPDPVQ